MAFTSLSSAKNTELLIETLTDSFVDVVQRNTVFWHYAIFEFRVDRVVSSTALVETPLQLDFLVIASADESLSTKVDGACDASTCPLRCQLNTQ